MGELMLDIVEESFISILITVSVSTLDMKGACLVMNSASRCIWRRCAIIWRRCPKTSRSSSPTTLGGIWDGLGGFWREKV